MDSATVIRSKLQIVNIDDTCILKYKINNTDNKLVLAPSPPCFFLRRGEITPQHFEYADVGVKAVIIVAGTLITNEQRKSWGLGPELICGNERQGILIYSDKIIVSKHVLKGERACTDKGSDEKDFWFFAHKK